MSYWQPIQTAPKDGTHIRAANFDPDHTGFGVYDGNRVNWEGVVHWWAHPGEEGFYLSSGAGDGGPIEATHWAPLTPEPMRKALREALRLAKATAK